MTLHAQIAVRLGDRRIDCELDAAHGRTLVVTGPNGAGKSTLLRAIAGLQPIVHGTITLDGTPFDEPSSATFVPPDRRDVAMMFQRDLLFPHLTAEQNIAFALRHRGSSRRAARTSAREWIERIGLAGRAGAKPSQMSGGEARRVALARALAPATRVVLLDEPLAPLDAESKPAMRRALREHLAAHEGIRVLVTHDPVEALSAADDVAVIEDGAVTQRGTPAELRARPRTPYVARFLGLNFFRGALRRGTFTTGTLDLAVATDLTDGPAIAVVAPAAVALHRTHPAGSPRNVLEAVVEEVLDEGSRIRVQLSGPVPISAEITPAAAAELVARPGERLFASIKATEIAVERA